MTILNDLSYTLAQPGDGYYSIFRRLNLAGNPQDLVAANANVPLYPGTIVLIPGWMRSTGAVQPPLPTTTEPVVTIDYTGAARMNGVTPADLRPYFSGEIQKLASTFDTWPGVQVYDGYTRHWHKAGKRGPGIELLAHIADRDSVTARWTIMLEEGWSWGGTKFGGKLGGVSIGSRTESSGLGGSETSGSVRFNWADKDGRVKYYVYHADQPGAYGDQEPLDAVVPVGRPVELGVDVFVRDGRAVYWMDGEVIWDSGKGRFRWGDGIGVSAFYQNVRFGGGTDEYGPANVSYSRFLGGSLSEVGGV